MEEISLFTTIRELKHRCFRATDVNRKFMFFLLARFYARPMSYKALILAFQLNIFNEKGVICVEEEKFRLLVDVRGSKTSVLKLSNITMCPGVPDPRCGSGMK